jgi:hypothetical protein
MHVKPHNTSDHLTAPFRTETRAKVARRLAAASASGRSGPARATRRSSCRLCLPCSFRRFHATFLSCSPS